MSDLYTDRAVTGNQPHKTASHPFNERGCYRCGRRQRLHVYRIGSPDDPPSDSTPLAGVTLCDPCYQSSNHGFWYPTQLTLIR